MPRIYVASLSDYNNGGLHGRWIDLDGLDASDTGAVQDEIAEMLRESRYPNVAVQCPDCYGEGAHPHATAARCETCKGSGTVPSAEEWAVHDYDDLPSSFGEHPDLEKLLEYVEMVEEHGDAWVAYMEDQRHNDPSEHDFNDRYAGEGSSELDWIYGYVEDTGLLAEVPEALKQFFDNEAYLRSMEAGGEISFQSINGTVYAFWNH